MPKPNEKKAVNPRFDAMKSIVKSHLDGVTPDSGGISLRQEMEAQGMEMADPDAELAPETKDSDFTDDLAGQNKDTTINIEDKTFIADVEDIKTEDAPEPEAIEEDPERAKLNDTAAATLEKEAKAEPVAEVDGMPVYEKDGKYYTKIIVNGVEEELDFDTVKASAQKDRASFERFQAAAAKEQELVAREAKLRAAETQQAVKSIAPEQSSMTAAEIDDTVDKVYDSLAYADEETVRAELAKIVSGQAQPQSAAGREEVSTQNEPVDVQAEVEAALERKAVADWESSRQAAVAQWEIDYADINDDEALRTFANEESARIATANPQQPIIETLKQAGEKAREWRDFQAGKAPVVDTSAGIDIESRTEKKRSAAAPVRANSAAASRKVEEDRPKTRSEVVADIRKGRGQAA